LPLENFTPGGRKTGSDRIKVYGKETAYCPHGASLATTVDFTNDGIVRRSCIRQRERLHTRSGAAV